MDGRDERLTAEAAPWLATPGARAVCAAVAAGGHRVLFVGGCVRNALLGAPVSDVDMATSAIPEEVIELATAAGLKPVPTGVAHGTVTVVADGTGYEVTTFRRDVQTDGRRAVVAFSSDIVEDARRRDFTINALYADSDGMVIDPLGRGLADLRARRVRFIENAQQRIREDYLRALRYFRFFAWYGDPSEGPDAEALAAIGSDLAGLETLSAERVGAEIRKLLEAADPSTALGAMAQTGALRTVLPGADIKFLLTMIHGEGTLHSAPDWLARLVALGGEDVPERLRLSNAEARRYEIIKAAAYGQTDLLETAYSHGAQIALQAHLIQCAMAERLPDTTQEARFEHAASAVFPVKAADLMPAYTGPALGARLEQLKKAWIASVFTLGKAELLALPPC